MINAIVIKMNAVLHTIQLDDSDPITLMDAITDQVSSNWYAVEDFPGNVWAFHGDSAHAHVNIEASLMLRATGFTGVLRGNVVFLGVDPGSASPASLSPAQSAAVTSAWHCFHGGAEFASLYQALLDI